MHAGEEVQLVSTENHSGYYMCRNAGGKEGLVPCNFLSPENPPPPFPHRPPFDPSSLPTETSEALMLHADAVNGFAVRLLDGQKEVAKEKDVIVSALSVHQGLAMAANGAEDRPPRIHSFTELTRFLGFAGLTSHTQVCSFFLFILDQM